MQLFGCNIQEDIQFQIGKSATELKEPIHWKILRLFNPVLHKSIPYISLIFIDTVHSTMSFQYCELIYL